MKIKNLLFILFFIGTVLPSFAQTSDAEAEAIVNLLGVQKKEAIGKLVAVSGKDSAAFWKIYNTYEKENKQVALSRLALYEKTAQSYSNMTAAVADSLAAKYFTNRFDQEKSLQEYYNKIKTATNAVVAFEFYQAEVYMLTQLRASIMQQMPTEGQLKLAQKRYVDCRLSDRCVKSCQLSEDYCFQMVINFP